mmetsp:Transcript_133000/g.384653  ORF Transcript_133000/g.384653 Transcript_133000/m.384653 type:complete len:277 (+) Transcript_133000:473-1303(+)
MPPKMFANAPNGFFGRWSGSLLANCVPSNGNSPNGGGGAMAPGRCAKPLSPRAPAGLRRSADAGRCWTCGTQRPPPTSSKRSSGVNVNWCQSPNSPRIENVMPLDTCRRASQLHTTTFPARSSTPQSFPNASSGKSECMKATYCDGGASKYDVPVSNASKASPPWCSVRSVAATLPLMAHMPWWCWCASGFNASTQTMFRGSVGKAPTVKRCGFGESAKIMSPPASDNRRVNGTSPPSGEPQPKPQTPSHARLFRAALSPSSASRKVWLNMSNLPN